MKIPLVQGSYMARGVIANAQSCINLVPEPNPKDAPFPLSHYPAPGLTVAADYTGQLNGWVRGLYFTSNGRPVAVVGQSVIRMVTGSGESPAQFILLGTLPTNSSNPVSMCDNQTDLVLVDGSSGGWYVPLAEIDTAGSMQTITDGAWYGSSRVDFIDTFLIFNWIATPTWYTTTSNVLLPFNPLYFAAKEGWNDLLVAVCALHDNVWVLGAETTEIWFNAGTGAATFPFQRMPASIIQQGAVGPYAIVVADNAVYWLSQDRWGHNMLMRGQGFGAQRVSNFAVEQEWNNYPLVSDAIFMAFQYAGHETIGMYFPTAGAWWAYDATTQMFHKRTYGGTSSPWLPSCTTFWGKTPGLPEGGAIIAGDRTGPRVFQVSRTAYTDAGTEIIRQRAFPHMVDDGNRVHYARFSAAFDGSQLQPDGLTLDWSDDGGNTYGNALGQYAQANGWSATIGQYQWRRLGMARDRVFRLIWGGQGEATLNGAWIDIVKSAT